MIGVFDSGVGGLTALRELRRLAPDADLLYLADRKNAPYGTKTEDELIPLVEKDIEELALMGAEKILIACCTASTVYEGLSPYARKISVPIIAPAARRAASLTKNGKIGVIATKRTAASRAFSSEIAKISDAEVTELETQCFVSMVERGLRDGRIEEADGEKIAEVLEPLQEAKIDTLILGCTHFPHIEKEISRSFPSVSIVNPSKEGAKALLEAARYQTGSGRTVYL